MNSALLTRCCTDPMKPRKGDKEAENGTSMEIQDGADTPQAQRPARSSTKQHDSSGKSHTAQKHQGKDQGKDQPRDMLYYAQKMQGAGCSNPPTIQAYHYDTNRGHSPPALDDTVPLESSMVFTPDMFDMLQEDIQKPTLNDILRAVHRCTASVDGLKEQFGGLTETVSLLRQDLQKIRERTTSVEGRISDMKDQMPPLTRDTRTALQQAAQATAKTEDIENRLRRNNVRTVGLPEKVEGRYPTAFIEQWLQDIFGKEAFTSLFAVERAHRTPPRPLPPGNLPRSMLARLLNYKDHEIILKLARERGSVHFNGTKISFYPDFSAEVQRKRAKFVEVKKRLQKLQVTYAMLFLAKLRITTRGQATFFETAAEATSWLDHNEQDLRRRRENERGD